MSSNTVVTAEMVREQARLDGMSDFVLSAVVGTLLGDASVHRPGYGYTRTSHIDMGHGPKQKDYIEYKMNILSAFVKHPISMQKSGGYGSYVYRLRTMGTETFLLLAKMVYPVEGCRKTVTEELLKLITHPIGLALWFGDDGTRVKNHNVGDIATNGFTKPEVDLLCAWLKDRWHIASKPQEVIHSSTGKHAHIIHIFPAGFITLSNLALQELPESMHYKLTLITKTCPVCGKVVPKVGQSLSCSPECQEKYAKQHWKTYYEEHKEEHRAARYAYAERYRETHREEIRAKSREKYASLSPEEKKKQCAKSVVSMKKKPEYYKMRAHERYEKRKEDPEAWEKYREERRAYQKKYQQRVKEDPVLRARAAEKAKKRRANPEYKKRQQQYRQNLKKNNPEKYAEMLRRSRDRKREQRAAKRAERMKSENLLAPSSTIE